MGKIRWAITALAVAISGAAGAALLVRGNPVKNLTSLAVAVISPYLAGMSLVAVAMAAWCHRRVLSAVALAIATVSSGVQISWHYLARPGDPGEHSMIRVLSANIRNGGADASSFVRLAEENADVILVVELTPVAVQHFSGAGISQVFPYSHLIPAPMAGGIGMWSRFPLVPLPVPQHPSAAVPAALLAVPGVPLETLLVGVHVKSPLAEGRDTVDDWRAGVAHVRSQLAKFATTAGAGAVVVAGDFNSTPDVRQFMDLLTDGYRDAVEQLGAGFSPTFPADRWYPPLYTIDHVLTRNSAASSVRTVPIAGSDHRGVLASIAIPGGSGSG
jgi:endonuclease/exonuclease/phosphatase (EEP) superfamily protein YafD